MCVPLVTVAISTFLQDQPTKVVPNGSSSNGSDSLLQPGEEQLIKVRLKCPLSIGTAGARACVLVNSKPTVDSLDSGLKVRVRYAINFLYRNPIIPGVVALHAQRLELSKDQPFWALRFQNTGNVDRIVRSHAKLIDTTGKVVYSKSSEKARGFVPNQCRTLRFPTPEIPTVRIR